MRYRYRPTARPRQLDGILLQATLCCVVLSPHGRSFLCFVRFYSKWCARFRPTANGSASPAGAGFCLQAKLCCVVSSLKKNFLHCAILFEMVRSISLDRGPCHVFYRGNIPRANGLIKRGSNVKCPSSVASWTGFCCRRKCVVLSPHGRRDFLLFAILVSVSERRGSLPSVALRSRARARLAARPPSGTCQVWLGCWMDPQARVLCPTLPRRSRLISPCPRCDGMMRCGHASASMSWTARRSSLAPRGLMHALPCLPSSNDSRVRAQVDHIRMDHLAMVCTLAGLILLGFPILVLVSRLAPRRGWCAGGVYWV